MEASAQIPTFNLQPNLLENGLVKLTPLQGPDFEPLYLIGSDPLIWEQHPDRFRYERDVFRIYFDQALNSGGAFLVHERGTNNIIGCTRYHDYNAETSRISIGYTFLARKYWGGIYNISLKKLMLDYAFQYVKSVIFQVGSENTRGIKSVEKIGAIEINVVEYNKLSDRIFLVHEYEIRKNEWLAKKTIL